MQWLDSTIPQTQRYEWAIAYVQRYIYHSMSESKRQLATTRGSERGGGVEIEVVLALVSGASFSGGRHVFK